jgi:hypothetical protein
VTVAEAAAPTATTTIEVVEPAPVPRELPDAHRALAFEHEADADASRAAWSTSSSPLSPTRWAVVRIVLGGLVAALTDDWSGGAGLAEQTRDDELGRGDVLDGQPDGLEDGDRLGVAVVSPFAPHAADLDQAPLRD